MTSSPEPGKASPESIPARKKKGIDKKYIWIAAAVVVALGVYFFIQSKNSRPPSKLIIGKVTKGDMTETATATGSITAQTGAEVKIGAQLAGQIKKLNADIGTVVKANDIIAELNLPDLRAQLEQARAVLAQAQLKYAQEVTGTNLTYTQTQSGITSSVASLESARQKLKVAQANYQQQLVSTPSDIKKATSVLAVATSALSVARSNLASVQASSNLAVVNATEQLSQAKANADNSTVNEQRELSLVNQGFAARADYDLAHAQALVNLSQVRAAQQNLELTKQKVALDFKTAQDQVTQATDNLVSSKASLDAAMSEKNLVNARSADIKDAEATVSQAQASIRLASAASANDTIKGQNVRIAKDAVTQAEQALAYAQAQYNKSFIRTPIAGTVLQLSAQQGETVSAGLSTQTLVLIADLNRLQVDAFVDENDIANVKIGQRAKFSVSAFPNKSFSGKVQKIAAGSTIQQGVVTYDVTIAIDDQNPDLKPDMTANVTIETGRQTGVLLIPAVAIQSSTKGTTVNVMTLVNGKEVVTPTMVVTGGTDGVNVQVTKGLKEGDQIVLAGVSQSSLPAAVNPFGAQGGGRGGGGGGR